MRMISLLVGATIVITPVTASAATPQQLENGIWQAFKDKKSDAFRAMFTAKYVGLYEDGTFNVARELESMNKTNLRSFAISNLTARPIDAGEDILTTYTVVIKGTLGKTDISGRYWCSSVWHRAGKNWLTAYHSEIKAK